MQCNKTWFMPSSIWQLTCLKLPLEGQTENSVQSFQSERVCFTGACSSTAGFSLISIWIRASLPTSRLPRRHTSRSHRSSTRPQNCNNWSSSWRVSVAGRTWRQFFRSQIIRPLRSRLDFLKITIGWTGTNLFSQTLGGPSGRMVVV